MASSSGSGSGQPGRRTTRNSWLPQMPNFVEKSFSWLDRSFSKLNDNEVADSAAALSERMEANELERNRLMQDAGINVMHTPTMAPIHNSTAINQVPPSRPESTPAVEDTPQRFRFNITQPSPLFNDSILNSSHIAQTSMRDAMNTYNTNMRNIREVISQDEEEQETFRKEQRQKEKEEEETQQRKKNVNLQRNVGLSPIPEQSEHSGILANQQNDSEASQSPAEGLDATVPQDTPVPTKETEEGTRHQTRTDLHRLPSQGLCHSSNVSQRYTSDETDNEARAQRRQSRKLRRRNVSFSQHHSTGNGVDGEKENKENGYDDKTMISMLKEKLKTKEKCYREQMTAQEDLYRSQLKKKDEEFDQALVEATNLINSQVETETAKDKLIERNGETKAIILAIHEQNKLIRRETKEQKQREIEKEHRDREEARQLKEKEIELAKQMQRLEIEERKQERESQMKEQQETLTLQHQEFKAMIEAQNLTLSQTLKEAGKNTSFNNSSLNISGKGSKWIKNVKMNPPTVCREDENIIVYLRTKFERHVSNNFHTREEQVMAFGMMYKNKAARCDDIKAIAERMLPDNPLSEGERLRVYRAIADKYNTTESTSIEKLKPGEDLDDLWKRAKIIEEELAQDTLLEGKALKLLNSRVLIKLLDAERNLMSRELRATLKSTTTSCVGMGWRRTGIDDSAMEDVLSEMIYEKAYLQKENKHALQVQKDDSLKKITNHVQSVEDKTEYPAQDIRLKSAQNAAVSHGQAPAVNYSRGNNQGSQWQGQRQGGYQNKSQNSRYTPRVTIETTPQFKYGFVAQDGQGCYGCNRPGHMIANCPFYRACRPCLKELGIDGKFVNDPYKVISYRYCTKPGHNTGYGSQKAAPQGAANQGTNTTQKNSANYFNVTQEVFFHSHAIPDGELALQNLHYQDLGQCKRHRVYSSENEAGKRYHFAELNVENYTGKVSRATFLLDSGCDADLVISMHTALSYGYAKDIAETENSAVVTVANNQQVVCKMIHVPVIYLGQSLMLEAIVMPECPNNLLGLGALRKMMLDDGTTAEEVLHSLCREISQSSGLKNQE